MSVYKDFNIFFYNNYHNGDVFYSKEFVRNIKNQIGISHHYIHRNNSSILKDFDINQIKGQVPNTSSLSKKGNDLYINTWVGQNGAKYLKYDCSLKSNYLIYTDIFKTLGIKLKPIDFYIPEVNFNKVEKIQLDKNKKYVLVCNNNVHSGQADNFNFDPIIDKISDKYKELIFIMTNNSNLKKDNVLYVNNILKKEMGNLLEISYLSTQTDIIIGRGSGPFCFSHIKDNMLNENKSFIVFTHKENEGKWVPDEASNAKQYWFGKFDTNDEVINSIDSKLKQIL
jgi:hypothetical protein